MKGISSILILMSMLPIFEWNTLAASIIVLWLAAEDDLKAWKLDSLESKLIQKRNSWKMIMCSNDHIEVLRQDKGFGKITL